MTSIVHTHSRATRALRRAAFALAAVTLCASAVASAAVDEAARALLPDDLKQKGTLTVAMPLDFEPFNYLD